MFIQAIDIEKCYNSHKIVKGISMDIKQNEILAIIGPNGAGKSTTIEMLIGLKKADKGRINYWNDAYKEQIGVQLQTAPFFVGLNAFENLKLFAALYKYKLTDEQVKNVLRMCGLYNSRKTDASKLSGGQQKRLAISIALVHNPQLLFLDEPTAALDPRGRQEIHELIRELHTQGKTVVFTSHDMDEVGKLATRIIMINEGEIMAQGNSVQLCEDHNVSSLEELYLQLTKGEEPHVSNNI